MKSCVCFKWLMAAKVICIHDIINLRLQESKLLPLQSLYTNALGRGLVHVACDGFPPAHPAGDLGFNSTFRSVSFCSSSFLKEKALSF